MPGRLTLPLLSRWPSVPESVVLSMPFVAGFCGAMPGAGRTTVLRAVAEALARNPQHLRVVVLESGSARGVLRERLGLPDGPTLEDVVRGAPGRDRAIQVTQRGFSLVAAPTGHPILPPVPAQYAEWVVQRLRAHFDVLLLDHGPDLGRMPDAHLLRHVCERLVVVVRATLPGAEAAAHTLSFLEAARGPEWLRRRVVVVLNGVDAASRIEAGVLTGWLRPRVAEVVTMPHEPGLAADSAGAADAAGAADVKLSGAGTRAVAAIVGALRRSPDSGSGWGGTA